LKLAHNGVALHKHILLQIGAFIFGIVRMVSTPASTDRFGGQY
jgi:hypothetical protein